MFVDHMLYDFRVNVPPMFSTGRRFARDVRDGSICSWTAEECLNFARITWRWFFQQFYTMLDRTGHIDHLNPIDLGSLDAVVGAWERFERWLFPVMDRNGLSLSLQEFSHRWRCARVEFANVNFVSQVVDTVFSAAVLHPVPLSFPIGYPFRQHLLIRVTGLQIRP